MAEDVAIQAEGQRTLHLNMLRKQWQIISLQVIATVTLVWMYLEIFQTYVVGSIDHTMLLSLFDQHETLGIQERDLAAHLRTD